MKKVLIIEDDSDQMILYKTVFEMSGFDVLVSGGGVEGLAKAKGSKPDLILLDIMMDDMNGDEVLEKLKTDEDTKNIPVAVLSNTFKEELINKCKNLGALYFWEKTKVMPRDVVEKSKNILGIK